MRNLWLFILRNNAFFLLIIFEALAISLLIRNETYQKASILNSANQVAGSIYQRADRISSYLALGRTNDSLAAENARLRSMLENAFYMADSGSIQMADSLLMSDSLLVQQFTYIPAKVVNNTVVYRNNWLTLNRGSSHGVKSGMGVIGPNGIAGIVKDVSEHFCTAYSILHKDVRVSVKLDSSGSIGSLVWPGRDPRLASMEDVPTHVQVQNGEKVVTTGFSLFPEATPVGRVKEVQRGGTASFLEIEVELATEFQRLEQVYIVANKFREEQLELEEQLEP